ncbi:BTAD domain-containing putative transcriptional regulator [Streptomyces sp.]|uniref:AfsR/SARP family transcriptional regulator n=1 Tax=Streptomyces sp. TaxID=1931 RepID=UPI00281157E4|nr:BTAD domain-containing putative transcriptional regulator [Streptomyces sp.]
MRYLILGTTEALGPDGSPLRLGGARLRALLAALALRGGRPASLTELVDDVYGDEPPRDAPAALQALAGRLRRTLGPGAVLSVPGPGYRLAARPEDIDLYVFRRRAAEAAARLDAGDPEAAAALFRDALALFRGPALADLPGPAGLRPEAQRLAALRRRVEADLRRGAPGLVPELTELTATYPYDEAFHAQLIRALRAEGRPADALAAFASARRTLADSLGTDPGPALTALHHELLTGGAGAGRGTPAPAFPRHPAADPAIPAAAGPPPPARPPAPGPDQGTGAVTAVAGGPADRESVTGPEATQEIRAPRAVGGAQGAPTRAPAPAPPGEAAPAAGGTAAFPALGATGAAPAPAPERTTGAAATATAETTGTQAQTPAEAPARTAPAAPPATALEHIPHPATGNIRPRLTSFVGREPDLAALREDLAGSRLVTLTGPGGSGKTRLAEEAARRAAGADAWIAELAPLDDPDALPGAVLSALRLRETSLIGRDGAAPLQNDPTAHLVEHLSARPFLLVLDNCEHVIDAAAALAETLLTHCPRLRVLATSREPLGVPGETVRPVEPLPPDPAHRLFAERARAVRPSFDPGREAAAVAEICRRLDGLPLAIELAAARLRLLTPRQIADRLDDRFRLLTSGARTVLPRQQTLRAVVDWSWDLLDPDERALLRQVSVFAGGWDMAAAEALAPDAAGTLGALVDKSLVVATPTEAGEMRYRLLETIHEYAAERAAETPELRAAAEAAHTAHVTALVEEAEPKLRSREQLPWIDRIERDLDNIRAALHRTLVTDPDEAAALRLVFAMGWFWWLRNYRAEAQAWVARAVALGDDPDDPADPRHWPRMRLRMLQFFLAVETEDSTGVFEDRGWTEALVRRVRAAFEDRPGPEAAHFPGLLWPFTAYLTEEPAVMKDLLDTAVDNCRLHGGDWEVGVSLMFRTHMVIDMPGDLPGVDEALVELRDIARRVGDRWMAAQIASAAGEAHTMRGRHAEAGEAYEEALALAREVGAHAEAPFLLGRLAELAYRAGDLEATEAGLDEASREAERYRVRGTQTYICFLRASLALHRGDVTEARAQLEEADRTFAIGTPPPHFEAVMTGLAARVEAYEGKGASAVARAVRALRSARDLRCADFIMAGMGDGLAVALAEAGEAALAVRVLAAVDDWRQGTPRSFPELQDAERVAARARAGLGVSAVTAARAAGAGLGVDDVLDLVEPFARAVGSVDSPVPAGPAGTVRRS